MTTTSPGQALLAMIESDLATVGGKPLMTFLSACEAANGNKALDAVALIQLVAAAPAAGIQLEVDVEQQLLSLAISRLQAFMAAKAAPATA